MSTATAAPTIPPRVRLDVDRMPLHDVLTALAARDRRRASRAKRFDVVYSPGRRMHG
ncbi:hypothetical protein AB0G49_14355 [Streptomyces longwoodensis]|uniref:hypothetical protein n=1 Tax=Streptomyces longwoodensis TaxID=68231 RepID=UPI0033DAD9B9